MALILCPNCNKRVSDKAQQCPHCQVDLQSDLGSLLRIQHIRKSQQLMTQSFIAMTLFIAGMVLWFWGGEVATGLRSYAALACFVFGFVGYLIVRIRMVLHKRNSV
ncbi:zinc ribbon domain-containing protein [Shewanella sp. NIFS-20-20]|uniref:zinc ribbon domain-containing protein n=1 Tax=Shewanella sp. NIFS-20-20 TaxID=2853806 RepID=UPI001C4580C4|nr:zinc ribbon domain-containing protein [Shewanella sp. NIFS-20-20]MBV7315219.1 zinc ribbon domain-containing protein [Shewanella sp. NIFS-20-20]